jgi:hypothetical protein
LGIPARAQFRAVRGVLPKCFATSRRLLTTIGPPFLQKVIQFPRFSSLFLQISVNNFPIFINEKNETRKKSL